MQVSLDPEFVPNALNWVGNLTLALHSGYLELHFDLR